MLYSDKMERKLWDELVGPGKVFHISRNLDQRKAPLPVHDHDFAELFWIRDGGGGHHWINGFSERLRGGSLVMLRPSDRHGYTPLRGQAMRMVNIGFCREKMGALRRRYFRDDPRWFGRSGRGPLTFQLDGGQLEGLEAEFRWLRMAPRTEVSIDTFCLNLVRILGPVPPTAEGMRGTPGWLLTAMRRFEDGEAAHAPTLRHFFGLCGRSPEHVARAMRAATGHTPSEWVNGVRLRRAARLLETTDQSVLEVALACGFESLSYFHRLFRRKYGMPPRGYRLRFGASF